MNSKQIDFRSNSVDSPFFSDTESPVLTIIRNPPGWTNKAVTLTAVASDNVGIRNIEYSLDNRTWHHGDTVSVNTNGTVYFRASDYAGNITESSVLIDSIDKVTPNVHNIRAVIIDEQPKNILISADFSDNVGVGNVSYRINYGEWTPYVDGIKINQKDVITFKVEDYAGNTTLKEYSFDQYIFVKSNFSSNTTGKKQNNIRLWYSKNAFKSLEDIPRPVLQPIILLDGKTVITNETDLSGISSISTQPTIPTVKEKNNVFDYKCSTSSKNTLVIKEADAQSVDISLFANVNISDQSSVGIVQGGKSSDTQKISEKLSGKQTTINENIKSSTSLTGKITVQDSSAKRIETYSSVTLNNAQIDTIDSRAWNKQTTANQVVRDVIVTDKYSETVNYQRSGNLNAVDSQIGNILSVSKVTLNNSTAGNIYNEVAKKTVHRYEYLNSGLKEIISYQNQYSANGSVNLKNGSEANFIYGYKNVKISDSIVLGSVDAGDCYNEKYTKTSNFKNAVTNIKESISRTYLRTNTFTAADSAIGGDISGYNKVTLDNSAAGDISMNPLFKISNMQTTEKLTGSVTLKNDSYAASISNYNTVSMTASTVGSIENVIKVNVQKGFSTLDEYIGTSANDLFIIARGATLELNGKMDFGIGKDKLKIEGTLILKDVFDFNAESITGKGEIAAAADVYEYMYIEFGNVLNLGATSEGFRSSSYEKSDDSKSKAAKWDCQSPLTGWLSPDSDCIDTVDFIRFTAAKDDVLTISGLNENDIVMLNDEEIDLNVPYTFAAGGSYVLKLERLTGDSVSYTLAMQ